MSGVVVGGWEFVIAAYVVTAAVLTAYGASVCFRYKAEKDRAATEARQGVKP
jgi:hypothetical protein